jgi:two-component system, LytTR family, response regulator
MIRVMIVDDEQFARQELATLLEEIGGCEIAASCANAIEALKLLNRETFDLLFLDIQMPLIDGFELLSMVEPSRMPHVVFVTAYDEYALKAFEEKTLDYLLKPVEKARLEKTFAKLQGRIQQHQAPESAYEIPALRHIPCHSGNRIRLIPPAEVEAVRSDLSGVHLLLCQGECFTDLTLKVLAERTSLLRCHRQYLVHPDRIETIQLLDQGLAEIRTRGGHTLPVSRRYLKSLKTLLNF